jgi:S-formylglutathione hydrolase
MLEELSRHACFGGQQCFYRHDSEVIGLPMRFSVFHPPVESHDMVPVLFYLAGLTCTEETFMMKGGAQQWAAQNGLMLVAPDTSPRNTGIEGATESWDFGEGAGFYLDALQPPWNRHFRMESYITRELLAIVVAEFNVQAERVGIFGHSMGGHGALALAFRHPDLFRSVSALAPISSAMNVPWGQKAFSRYLGADPALWAQYDACELIRAKGAVFGHGILVDQGTSDQFLSEQLQPERLEAACAAAGQPLALRRREGYDHGYYFIQSFMRDHIAFHKDALSA